MRNDQLIEFLEAKLGGFKAEIKAGLDMHEYKLDELIKYQKTQNDRLGKLEKETKIFRLIHRNPKASAIIIGLCILGGIMLFIIKNTVLNF